MLLGLADAEVCVMGDVPGFVVAPGLPGCASVDPIAVEPVGAALSRPAEERLLKAREPMTAIPAKPPVVVTLRMSERRRWEWRLRWRPAAPAAEPACWTNSDSAKVVAPWSAERAAACVRARSLIRPRPRSARMRAVAPESTPWFPGAGIAGRSRRLPAGRRFWTPEGEACACSFEPTLAPHPGQDTTPLSSLRHEVQ
jgi:hypothetical protein